MKVNILISKLHPLTLSILPPTIRTQILNSRTTKYEWYMIRILMYNIHSTPKLEKLKRECSFIAWITGFHLNYIVHLCSYYFYKSLNWRRNSDLMHLIFYYYYYFFFGRMTFLKRSSHKKRTLIPRRVDKCRDGMNIVY